jgi:hypothetical protein
MQMSMDDLFREGKKQFSHKDKNVLWNLEAIKTAKYRIPEAMVS